jgi:type II secretory pathway pseudopilin PulG
VENIKDKVLKIFFIASLAVVAVVFVASFFVVESPAQARERKLDEEIINNFGNIYQCVDQYYRETQKLPTDFAAMQADCTYLTADNLKDSQTGQAFVYSTIGTTTYQICANFRTSNVGKANNFGMNYPAAVGSGSSSHNAGYQCLKNQVYPAVKIN